jgi:hypothetical protein
VVRVRGSAAHLVAGLVGFGVQHCGGEENGGERTAVGPGRGGTTMTPFCGLLSEGVRANAKVVATIRPDGAGRHGGRAAGVGRLVGAVGERTESRVVAAAAAAAAVAGPAGDCCLSSTELPPVAGLTTRPDGNGRHPGRTVGVDGVCGVGLEGEGEEMVLALEALEAEVLEAALEGGEGLGGGAAAGR